MSISELVKNVRNQFNMEDFYPASVILNEETKTIFEEKTGRSLLLYDDVQQITNGTSILPEHIFFSAKGFSTYYYFKFPVLIDLPSMTKEGLKMMLIEDRASFTEKRLTESIQNGDYESLFSIIDSRLKMMAFNELFTLLKPEEKYNLFISVYTKEDYDFNVFNPLFVEESIALQPTVYKEKMLQELTEAVGPDETITIYRGQGTSSTPFEKAMSWTLKLSSAEFFAQRYSFDGIVYKAKAKKVDVIDYIRNRNEEEILIKPEHVFEVEDMNYIKVTDELGYLSEMGHLEAYHYYLKFLKADYFRNPKGIHGIKHTERVMIHLVSLAAELDLDDEDIDVLMKSGLFHDIGRMHDLVDDFHGEKSWEKVKDMDLLVFEAPYMDEEYVEENAEVIEFIIKNHCIDDESGYENLRNLNSDQSERIELLFKVFKDADNLDRVRLRDLDPKYLRLEETKKRVLFAEALYQGHK